MHERGQRLQKRLKYTLSEVDMGADQLGAIGIGLKTMLQWTRIKKHTRFFNANAMLARLYDLDRALAQKMKVSGSLRVMIT